MSSRVAESHAQNVARGHKAAIDNPNVSEEAKEHSRQILEEIEGSSNPAAFVASTDSEKAESYDPSQAIRAAGGARSAGRS